MKDTQLFESVERELNRQRSNIELIASENFVSKEVLELVLYNREEEGIKIPKSTPLENIKCKENEKTVTVSVWMPLVRNEMEEQAVKKTLTIPQWLNKLAEAQNVNFSKVLQSALKELLGDEYNQGESQQESQTQGEAGTKGFA